MKNQIIEIIKNKPSLDGIGIYLELKKQMSVTIEQTYKKLHELEKEGEIHQEYSGLRTYYRFGKK